MEIYNGPLFQYIWVREVYTEFVRPFVIAALKNQTIEVHNIQTQTLVQVIDISGFDIPLSMSVIAFPVEITFPKVSEESDSFACGVIQIIITFKTSVKALLAIPWQHQAEQLFKAGEPEQAITVVQQSSPSDSSHFIAKTKDYYLRAFIACLKLGKFDKCLGFAMVVEVDPRIIISLLSEDNDKEDLTPKDWNSFVLNDWLEIGSFSNLGNLLSCSEANSISTRNEVI